MMKSVFIALHPVFCCGNHLAIRRGNSCCDQHLTSSAAAFAYASRVSIIPSALIVWSILLSLPPPSSVGKAPFDACLTSIDRRLEFAKPRDCDYTSGMTKDRTFSLDKSAPGERIAKRIARAGICSRREAEARIADGRVSVNGKTITSPAQ